jgi:hypothetical protein
VSQLRRFLDVDFPTHARRGVWIAWTILLLAAAAVYAGKAADERSAFIRWRHQVHDFWQGANIWDIYMFPNPPIMPITLSPLMALPPVTGAVAWFALKALMATACIVAVLRMVRGPDGPPWPWWGELLVIVLSLRPLLSDLHHGNINILILALIVAMLAAWRSGLDVLAGLLLALAITMKVTPALFVPYFIWKRSWRTAGSSLLGLGIFLLVVPSIFMGAEFNGRALAMWWHRILSPFVAGSEMSEQEVNQSMVGVLTRLLTASRDGRYGRLLDLNVVALSASTVATIAKGMCVGIVALMMALCRTRTVRRDDPRLVGEFALVVLTMLIVSERSWKHHFVTLLLPYAYVVYRAAVRPGPRRVRVALSVLLGLSALLIATTSSEVGGLVLDGLGHKYALGYGMYFWGAVALYAAVAWRVVAERGREIRAVVSPWATGPPSPHLAGTGLASRTGSVTG